MPKTQSLPMRVEDAQTPAPATHAPIGSNLDYSAEEDEFLCRIVAYKKRVSRQFLAYTEVLKIVRDMDRDLRA